MADYLYHCPNHGVFRKAFRMGSAASLVDCPLCGRQSKRRFVPVPIKFVGDGFSTSGKFDRPDERLDKEIKSSMTHDPTTGEEWEAQDKTFEKKKKHFGKTMRKEFTLPQKSAE